ncbi:TRAP transporter large permease [Stappia taiwanensis]|uniref:TRAP transporter large permease protein n=1 Tax=Stappia taiwanensis TaxID=992267 RepID=A0A838XSN5_9HYPH|nr:TRAP transporter large permease [Stappia taiwanensis]MBA4612071.1 TRAP transporter large permease [Stappia taiwanensis]GGE91316.1 C4-dicarboxylate ABC transporter permease [Stappia taiwanensis]
MTTVFILAGLFSLLLAGIPVAFALAGLGFLLLALGGFSPLMVPQGLLSAADSFVLISVPLFLLMSNVLLKGGVGRDLFAAVQAWVGHWPGGLAVATILSCGIFAAISGSSVATAATIGTVAIPEMTERGYPRRFVLGLLAAGGTLGILIPPSIPMIVYGVITEESIIALFLAGVGPGLLLMGLFILWSMLYARFASDYRPSPRAGWDERFSTLLRALPTILLAALVILGIYGGVFTPTEAAAVGFLGALVVVGLLLRTLDWPKFKEAVMEAMTTSVAILLIVAGAKVFGKAITLYRIPQDISMALSEHISTAGVFVAVVALVLLVMGLFLESLSMMLIMVPVLAGALTALGLDPVWFGVFFVIMVECALITPPVGLNLYVIQAVGKASMGEVSAGVWPFLAIMLSSVLIIFWWPDLVLYLPFKF